MKPSLESVFTTQMRSEPLSWKIMLQASAAEAEFQKSCISQIVIDLTPWRAIAILPHFWTTSPGSEGSFEGSKGGQQVVNVGDRCTIKRSGFPVVMEDKLKPFLTWNGQSVDI